MPNDKEINIRPSITISEKLKILRANQKRFADQALDAAPGSLEQVEAQASLDHVCTKINECNDFIYNMKRGRS